MEIATLSHGRQLPRMEMATPSHGDGNCYTNEIRCSRCAELLQQKTSKLTFSYIYFNCNGNFHFLLLLFEHIIYAVLTIYFVADMTTLGSLVTFGGNRVKLHLPLIVRLLLPFSSQTLYPLANNDTFKFIYRMRSLLCKLSYIKI